MITKDEKTTYVIYDQFHWLSPDHLEIPVKGWTAALEVYRMEKVCRTERDSLGLTTLENYKKLKQSYEDTGKESEGLR
jgi:hypothetical protein